MKAPFISICVPAYKRPDYMERLLKSIQIQSFRDFEVIVTDNSPDNSVETTCRQFASAFKLHYFRNNPPLGISPNWNAAVEKSGGEWIKILHSDDWFTDEKSLEKFAAAARQHPESFIFSAYLNCSESTGASESVTLSPVNERLLRKSPFHLLRGNYIGPPSTNLIHRSIWQAYNPALKWIADFEGYIRMLQLTGGQFQYLQETLVCIGLHEEQTTSSCALNPEVEVPENTVLYNTFRTQLFQNFFAYDYFWRLIRNLNIKSVSQFEGYLAGEAVPPALKKVIQRANSVPKSLRSLGAVSKSLAFLFWTEQLLRKSPEAPAQRAAGSSSKH